MSIINDIITWAIPQKTPLTLIEEPSKEDICPICQMTAGEGPKSQWTGHIDQQDSSKIHHIFHKNCIMDWHDNGPIGRCDECPDCREPLNFSPITSLSEKLKFFGNDVFKILFSGFDYSDFSGDATEFNILMAHAL